MLQIRNNCFETNSSSSHSLVIKPGFDYYTSEEILERYSYLFKECKDEPGRYILKPWGHEFDDGFNRWPFQVLDNFSTKLWYLYAHAPVRRLKQTNKYGDYRWATEYYKITNFLRKELPWLKGVDWSYCSDKPSSEAQGFTVALKKAGISWYEYLFNKNIIVICDGDEYCVWNRLKKHKLVKLPKGTKEYIYG